MAASYKSAAQKSTQKTLKSRVVAWYCPTMNQNATAPKTTKTVDKPFIYALDHFIRMRGWTLQRLSDLSREKDPDSPIHPHMITKWRAGTYPAMSSVLALCRLFGVTRSFFFFVGERLAEFEALQDNKARSQLRVLHLTLPDIDEGNEDLLRQIETYVNNQKTRLARQATAQG